MALRWYSIVIDCSDVAAQAAWWAEAIDWKPAYTSADEVVLVPSYVDQQLIESTPWERTSPGLVFVASPDDKGVKNRIHIDLAPHLDDDRDAEIERLLALGATRVDVGQRADASWTVLADPEGNEFCVLSARAY